MDVLIILSPVFAAVVALCLTVVAWRRRPTTGSIPFTVLTLAVAIWSYCYAFELAGSTLGAKLFWARMEYLGIIAAPLAWAAFGLEYSGRGDWLRQRPVALFAIEPIVILILVWTNAAHDLIWQSASLERIPNYNYPILAVTYGPAFWVHTLYSYLGMLLGTILVFRTVMRSPTWYRGQGVALLAGALLPWLANVLYLFDLTPLSFLDLSPFAFVLSGIAFAWGLRGFRLLDIVPVAHERVFKSMSDGVIVLDQQGRVVEVNPAATLYLNAESPRLIGRPASEVLPASWRATLAPDDHRELCAEIQDDNSNQRPQVLEVRGMPLSQRGRISGRMILVRDITDRKAIEQLMVEQRALERSNRELEQFAVIASHDLQEPLRKIRTFGDRLESRTAGTLDAQSQEYLGRVLNAAGRMQALIKDLLTYSRVTTQLKPLEPVNLKAIMDEMVLDLEISIHDADALVMVGDLPTIDADSWQMKRLFQNLIGNAIKFRRPDVRPIIEVRGCVQPVAGPNGPMPLPVGDICVITVTDNGIGFDEKYADRIFRPFQQLQERDQYEGTGIGLAICQRIVERHYGTITVRSEPEAGSTFIVTLPLRRPEGEVSQWTKP